MTTDEVVRNICTQLSLMTGLDYAQFVIKLFPSSISDVECVIEAYKRLSHSLTENEKYLAIKAITNVSLPCETYTALCQSEHDLDIQTAQQKWGLLAEYAARGCLYSANALGNLFFPLADGDPIICYNPILANKLLTHVIRTLELNRTNDDFIKFETMFNTILCESKLKIAMLNLDNDTRAQESKALIQWVWRHSPHYSRTRKYIKRHFSHLLD
ncbi:hypothetical protein J8L70_08215 [Pseudoalteromonas sp. MMG010]|uniref:hypothetical protein n=1 Tax=Pseudoalteromonas sp. MMG010 TaxID=2822685 RepID=UPI001B39D0AA|nr:hypothetical protein [Pseudoalteromonas sp. MMG010]MBQ4833222.1 hypothetical protein [Pseudoalteromonas sp. MMG010]